MRRIFLALAVAVCWSSSVLAVDHKVQPLDEAPPVGAISDEVGKQLASKGLRVVRGESRTVCDIWLCKEWVLGDKPTAGDVLYPFQPGQLMGVVRFSKKSSDFRDQDIAEGVYTLRYGQQPVDGAHVGTSPTRDFLLLLNASQDKSVAAPEYKPLTQASARAAGSNHPLLLSLQRLSAPAAAELPSIRHEEEKDWWIVAVAGQTKSGTAVKKQVLELVVVGKAGE